VPVFSIIYAHRTSPSRRSRYPLAFLALAGLFLLSVASTPAQETSLSPAKPNSQLFDQVVANQKASETELRHYERTQRVETRKAGADRNPITTKVWRVFPTGTGVDRILLSPDAKPISPESYRSELEKLERYLVWAAQDGVAQKEAYAKAERKRKERFDLIEATRQAFFFTLTGKETRDGRSLLRYSMEPNPKYKPTSRNTILFTRVRGTIWVDEQSSQLARVEGTVTEDISLALFLAKVYKGSHFMQERYEIAPGIWEPTFEQYDFDGRKYLFPFSIHERTSYTNYKRVGPPKESVGIVRAELDKLRAESPALGNPPR
jgi:hypothetical protein